MALYAACDLTVPHVVRAVVSNTGGPPPEGFLCVLCNDSDRVSVGYMEWVEGSGFVIYSAPEVPSSTPAKIVAALKAIDPAKARAIIGGADPLDWAEFMTAATVRLDEPRLLAALNAVGISAETLKAAL